MGAGGGLFSLGNRRHRFLFPVVGGVGVYCRRCGVVSAGHAVQRAVTAVFLAGGVVGAGLA